MRYLGGGRATGKTTRCLALLKAEPEAILVTMSEGEARRLREIVPEAADRILSAGTLALLGNPYRGRMIVDNAELVLGHLLGGEVMAMSATDDGDWMRR